MSKAFVKRHILAVVALLALTLFINLPQLSGAIDTNPLLTRTGLSQPVSAPVIGGSHTIEPNDGIATQSLGTQIADQWSKGKLPLWNQYEGIGVPLSGEGQGGSFFLPFVMLFKSSSGPLLLHMLLELITGLSMYALILRLGGSRLAGLAGAGVFAANGNFAWIASASFNPVPFLPFTLLGIEFLRDKNWRIRAAGSAIVALGLGWAICAGFPEVAFINGLLILCWTILRVFQTEDPLRFLVRAGASAAVGLALSAPFVLTFATYLPDANLGMHEAGAGASELNLPIWSLPGLIHPYIFGPIRGLTNQLDLLVWWGSVGGFFNFAALLVGMVGLLSSRARGLKLVLLGWVLVCTAKSYGAPIVSPLLAMVPGIGESAFYRYCTVSSMFAIAILAALAIDDVRAGALLTAEKAKKALRLLIAAGAVALGFVAWAFLHSEAKNFDPSRHHWFLVAGLWTVGLVGAIIFALVKLKNRNLAAKLLAGLMVVEAVAMFMVPSLSGRRMSPLDEKPVQFLKQNLKDQRYFTLGPIGPNYGSYFNLRSINHNDLPIAQNWVDYVLGRLQSNTIPTTFDGVYKVNPKGPSPKQEFLRLIDFYRDVGVRYVLAPPREFKAKEIASKKMELVLKSKTTWIYDLGFARKRFIEPTGACKIQIVSEERANFDCTRAALATRDVLNLRGWQIKVNSKPVKVADPKSLRQDFMVPAGKSTATFRYWPTGMTASLVAAIIGLLITFGLLISAWVGWRPRLPRRSSQTDASSQEE